MKEPGTAVHCMVKLRQGQFKCNVDVRFYDAKEKLMLAGVLETTWEGLYWHGALGYKGNSQHLKEKRLQYLKL
ncbi:hypothetical protein L195_g045377 [Trifolium pratense]|uniref:Uncharacterized protein n=1 Tax=Trifolium pratense TaxID=57577 RepID=A0A2K3LVS4_TRIPR|nr:hypothetical protein L195_g038639 [Trifolium pratense]PNX89259.1 hypothetical protein L195_g045377 [Trifolium pratense]